MQLFEGKTIVITGGTGSLGKVLTRRLLTGNYGNPRKIIIFSRDEAKQHFMRVEYQNKKKVTDEVIYDNFRQMLEFRIGDVRNYHSICSVLKGADMVINAAALKQVPSCEYFPYEAVETNITGAENIVKAIRENDFNIQTAVCVSTDKACKPINVMGMTKAIQERVFIAANISVPSVRFICVRYGNVLASRGSVIPLFHEQITSGLPVTITTDDMTRFLLPLESAVDIIFAAVQSASPGETYIPRVPSALIMNVAKALIGHRGNKIVVTGIRPGEKIHEILVSEEEAWHTIRRGDYYVIRPMLPELMQELDRSETLKNEYSSKDNILSYEDTVKLLERFNLMLGHELVEEGEFLR